jgi:hypothetical protein
MSVTYEPVKIKQTVATVTIKKFSRYEIKCLNVDLLHEII